MLIFRKAVQCRALHNNCPYDSAVQKATKKHAIGCTHEISVTEYQQERAFAQKLRLWTSPAPHDG